LDPPNLTPLYQPRQTHTHDILYMEHVKEKIVFIYIIGVLTDYFLHALGRVNVKETHEILCGMFITCLSSVVSCDAFC